MIFEHTTGYLPGTCFALFGVNVQNSSKTKGSLSYMTPFQKEKRAMTRTKGSSLPRRAHLEASFPILQNYFSRFCIRSPLNPRYWYLSFRKDRGVCWQTLHGSHGTILLSKDYSTKNRELCQALVKYQDLRNILESICSSLSHEKL